MPWRSGQSIYVSRRYTVLLIMIKDLDQRRYGRNAKWHNAWWRHQMETFSALLAICAGKSPVTGEFPAQRPVTRSFDVFFDLRLNNDLRRHCHITIMVWWGLASCVLIISDWESYRAPSVSHSTDIFKGCSTRNDEITYQILSTAVIHERLGVSNHWPHDYLFNSLLRLRTKENVKSSHNCPSLKGFQSQRASDAEAVFMSLCNDVITSPNWKMNELRKQCSFSPQRNNGPDNAIQPYEWTKNCLLDKKSHCRYTTRWYTG